MVPTKSALRSDDIRRGNEKLVLHLIHRQGAVSQSEIVDQTGLKAPTILRIFTNLKDSGLIQLAEIDRDRPSDKKGRKPVFYSLNPEALYVVGVEFWAASLTVVICNFLGTPVYSGSFPLEKGLPGAQVLEKIESLIRSSLEEVSLNSDKVMGLGIGAPGRVDTETGTIQFYSRISDLNNVNLKRHFEERLDIETIVHNNTSVMAMHQYRVSGLHTPQNLFAILLRGGVGGAYINEGKVVTSGKITSFEIGHLSVDPKGRECQCGWRGCLETYLSEEAILQDMNDQGAGKVDMASLEALLNEPGSNRGKLVRQVLDEKAVFLAYAIKNITNLLSPENFLVITRSQALSDYLSGRVEKILRDYPPYPEETNPRFIPRLYDPHQAGMGACDLVFHNYFQTSCTPLDQD
jgi:predicted NBD/HSP70 family sugar kinase